MNVKTQPVANQKFEVVLHVVIHGKAKNLSLFTLEVQQAGIFYIDVLTEQLEQVIKNNCVSFLYPYLSQVVTNTIVQAGFPPVVLQPLQPAHQGITLEQFFNQTFNQKKESAEKTRQVEGVLEKGAQKPN
jgi:preprotein translocase subunit SecB